MPNEAYPGLNPRFCLDPSRRLPRLINTEKLFEEILGIQESPGDDFSLYRSEAIEGSCRWITKREAFRQWTELSDNGPKVYWITGPPATGKSILAAYVAEYIRICFLEVNCQYHFFGVHINLNVLLHTLYALSPFSVLFPMRLSNHDY